MLERFRVALLVALLTSPTTRTVLADPPPNILLTGGKLVTMSDRGTFVADLLVKDGRIAAIGQSLEVPATISRIDVSEMTVTPGLIDACGVLWLSPAAAREGAGNGGLDVRDGIDIFLDDWRSVARQGITSVYVQPASSGVLGGGGALLRVAPVRTVDDVVVNDSAAVQASIGTKDGSRTSQTRYAQFQQIEKALSAAQKYGEAWKKYEEYQAKRSEKKDDHSQKSEIEEAKPVPEQRGNDDEKTPQERPDSDTKDASNSASPEKPKVPAPPQKPTRDPAKERLLRVLRREVPLRIEAHREDDISHAFKLADKFGFRLVLEGVSAPRSMIQRIHAENTPLVVGPILKFGNVPSYRELRSKSWLTDLVTSDTRWALATFTRSRRGSRFLRAHAAAAVAWGMKSERILRAVTTDAAAILGVTAELGSLEIGKVADISVFAGEPLDAATTVRMVLSHGKVVYDQSATVHSTRLSADPRSLPDPLPTNYVIRSTRMLREDGHLRPAQLLVRGNRIAGVYSSDDRLPKDVENISVFDLGDAVVTPGLFIGHAHLEMRSLIDDGTDPIAAEVRAADALDPTNPALMRFRSNGFLRVALAPGSKNLLSGNVALLKPATSSAVIHDRCALKWVVTSDARDADRYPASLAGQVELIERLLSGEVPDSRFLLPPAVQRVLTAERKARLAALAGGETVALFETETNAETRAALELIGRFKLRAALLGPREVKPFLDELRRLSVGVVVRPLGENDYDRHLDDLVSISQSGVPLAFAAESAAACRTTVSLAVSAGMSEQAALRALTSGAASVLGLDESVCSLQEQSAADFVIWNGSPVDLRCRPMTVVMDGRLVRGVVPDAPPAVNGDSPPNQVAGRPR